MRGIKETFDKIIIGAGLYGLYSALFCGKRGQSVLVLECDASSFGRATCINQARVHQGYHYPRSLSTAIRSANYFERFNEDYGFCINREFQQIYATSSQYSWTDAKRFKEFCYNAQIPCEEIRTEKYFKNNMCDGAFLTKEYTYDAQILNTYFLEQIAKYKNVHIRYGMHINKIERIQDAYRIYTDEGQLFQSAFVVNTTYASTNQILKMAGFDPFKIKYELCEIILCNVNEELEKIGFTVMDGPFFSIMPFGKTGLHSLTSVTFTPHTTSYEETPTFACQTKCGSGCSSIRLGNCNNCDSKPDTSFPYMEGLAKKYIREEYQFKYSKSLFSMKPILMSSEVDDSRPTIIKSFSSNPTFVSVLSGKINTVYDLDEVLSDE